MNGRRPPSRSAGLTLVELLVTVVILGIVGGITIRNSLSGWRDAQLTELANQFALWLEEISRSPEASGSSCTVTLTTTNGTLSSGSQLASVSPSTCAPVSSFRLANTFGKGSIAVGASSGSIQFTPRSAITSSSDIQVRFALPAQAPVRCVRISAVLGLIRLGRDSSSSSTSSDCPASSFDTI